MKKVLWAGVFVSLLSAAGVVQGMMQPSNYGAFASTNLGNHFTGGEFISPEQAIKKMPPCQSKAVATETLPHERMSLLGAVGRTTGWGILGGLGAGLTAAIIKGITIQRRKLDAKIKIAEVAGDILEVKKLKKERRMIGAIIISIITGLFAASFTCRAGGTVQRFIRQ